MRWRGDDAARRAVYNNRSAQRWPGRPCAELVERGFAHVLDHGGMRRTGLRGRDNVHKRTLIHVAGHNLGILMRLLIGAGTPREAVARGVAALLLVWRQDQSPIAIVVMIDAPAAGFAAAVVILTDQS